MSESGFQILVNNIKATLSSLLNRGSRLRQFRSTERDRSRAISRNFFLHIHSARIHKYSLQPSYTMGLGLISFFLFLILTFTGILLMFYYTPSIERAYASILDITHVVVAGRFIRNIHRWAAHGMVLSVILHMVRVFYTGSYKRNRGFNWIIGIALLLCTLLLSFSGYLLPWDQLAFWAVTIGSNIAGSASELTEALGLSGIIDPGRIIKNLLIGGSTVEQPALIRFYLLHIIFLPLLSIVLIGVHFWRIRKDGGLSRPDNADLVLDEAEKKYLVQDNLDKNIAGKALDNRHSMLSWPSALWAEGAVFVLTLAVLLLIAYFYDAPLKEMANPSVPENPAKSPWYFLGLQELVSYSAFAGGIAIPFMLIVALISIPFLDREDTDFGSWFAGRAGKRVTLNSLIYALVITLGIIAFTIQAGWIRDWFDSPPQLIVILFNPATVLTFAYMAWAFYILRKTASTRMSALALFSCCLVGFIILTVLGMWFRGPDWQFFWLPSQWPPH